MLILIHGSTAGTISPNLVVNAPGFVVANNSPSLVGNPRRPANLVVVHRVDQPPYSASMEWSVDGGRRWRTVALPLAAGWAEPYAPDATFAPDGTLYISYVSLRGTGHVPDALWVAQSSDGGGTLSGPVRVAGPLAFQARIVAGANGLLHVIWLQASDIGQFSISGAPSPIVSSTSTDHGRTFGEPVQLSDAGRNLVGAATPVIDSQGHLAVLYKDFKGDRRDFENLDGPAWDRPFSLVATRSADKGRSFATGIEVDTNVVPARRFVVFLPEFPSLAAGPGASLYVGWADKRNGDEDVFLRRSVDGGRTWLAPQRVNDNRLRDGTNQSLPQVAVAPNGRVDVLFMDGRRDPSGATSDVYLASSGNNGRSFRNLRMTSSPFQSGVGPQTPQGGTDFGSHLGLISEKDRVLAAWTDSRLGNRNSRRQDIVFASLSRKASWRATTLWSVVAGLTAAVIVLALRRIGRLGVPSKDGSTITPPAEHHAGAEGG